MASSMFSHVDEYGFERPENFDYKMYENFMAQYIRILANRSKRWEEQYPTDNYRISNVLKRFVRKGIPSNRRETAWLEISGARRYKQEATVPYTILKKNIEESSITEIIQIDVPRTFPDNIYFAEEGVLPIQLFNVLATFAQYNQEVGYCQGLNYIAGLLLLVTKSEESSFWLLHTLINNILPMYYVKNMSGLLIDFEVLDELVQKYEIQVYRHIKEIGMPWAVVTTKWFICLYAEVLPTETVLRIWDCIFYEGSKIIFRVALALIKIHKNEILQTKDLAELVTCFRQMRNSYGVINCHQFINDMVKAPTSFSNKTLEKLRMKHSQSILK